MEKLTDLSLTRKFIDNDPIGTLIFRHLSKAHPEAVIYCDNPDNPQFIFGQFGWFHFFDALTDEAADEFVRQLPQGNIAFGGIRHKWAEKMLATRKPVWHNPCHLIYWPGSECNLPVEHPVRTLEEKDAPIVNEHWDLGQGKAEDYIRERILNGPTTGYDDEEGLASWALTHDDGSIGFLYTMKRARQKGYAKTVGIALMKKILDAGGTPFGYIIVGNETSLKFSLEMGLKTDGYADYLELHEVK